MTGTPGRGAGITWSRGIILAVVLALVGCTGSAGSPTPAPTRDPEPTATPTSVPTATATETPTSVPTATPTATATGPTATPKPTAAPTATPTPTAAPKPTAAPTAAPTATPKPTAAPTATPKPTAAPTATPKPTAAPSILVRYGSRSQPKVALTFDMGGRVDDAVAIVTWLRDNRVPATIFMTGAMVDNRYTDAGRRVLAMIDADPVLFDLGNHSYSHPDFRDLTRAQILDELTRTEASIARYTSVRPRPLFRPPFGGYNADVLAAVGAAGYSRTVLWDVDTIDWRPPPPDGTGPTAQQMVNKVVANAQNGSIVLMHLGGYETFKALPSIVSGLRERGLEPVTLQTLLGS